MSEALPPEELFGYLCWYDPRNPNTEAEEDTSVPRQPDCACDPCMRGTDLLAMEIIRLRGLDRDWKKAADFIRRMWNDIAGHAGFPKLKKMTAARVSQVRATIRDHGANQVEWMAAIQRYVDSAKAWPERKRFGFDSFIRAKNRDQWFEGAAPQAEPGTMTQEEADAYYTEGL